MAATRNTINGWLDRLYADENLTHLIVVCDDFDMEDYPAFVHKTEDVHKRATHFREASMQRVMEVYSRNHTREEQMSEQRAFHYD